jgi:hypothetical protein
MNRLLLVLSLFVGLPFAGLSQGVQSGANANRIFTRADTVQALHDIFRNGRRGGKIITALAPVAAGIAIYSGPKVDLGINALGSSGNKPNGHLTAVAIAVPAAIAFAIAGPLSWSRNSKKKEQETIRRYEMRLPLSRRVQRKLHRQLGNALHSSTATNR